MGFFSKMQNGLQKTVVLHKVNPIFLIVFSQKKS